MAEMQRRLAWLGIGLIGQRLRPQFLQEDRRGQIRL
jgi:hypothetical protein